MNNSNLRKNIHVGALVRIVEKQNQRTGKLTEGRVNKVLTHSSEHPYGIKVELENGIVGRVKEIVDSNLENNILIKSENTLIEKLTTSEGPAGIGTLSKLAETFSSAEEQEKILEAIGGFKQSVQLEIIKQSSGKIENIQELKEEALDGAFDTVVCHGIKDCHFIPENLRKSITDLIKTSEKKSKEISFKEKVKSLK